MISEAHELRVLRQERKDLARKILALGRIPAIVNNYHIQSEVNVLLTWADHVIVEDRFVEVPKFKECPGCAKSPTGRCSNHS